MAGSEVEAAADTAKDCLIRGLQALWWQGSGRVVWAQLNLMWCAQNFGGSFQKGPGIFVHAQEVVSLDGI